MHRYCLVAVAVLSCGGLQGTISQGVQSTVKLDPVAWPSLPTRGSGAQTALQAPVSAGTIQDANRYMDLVLNEHLPPLVRGTPALFPEVRIPDFSFKILKTGITNRDLKANITDGGIHGFDLGIQRQGDCEHPVLLDGNTTVKCVLNMTGVGATFTATTKGDNLAGTIKTIWVNVTLKREAKIKVGVTAHIGKTPALNTFIMEDVKLKTKYDSHLSLNDEREDQFEDHIEEEVKDTLLATVYNVYKVLLERAIQLGARDFPVV